MHPSSLAASARTHSPWLSVEAYVLPQLLEVAAGAHGIVAAVLVAPHDLVRAGEVVAIVEQLRPSVRDGADRTLCVKAPTDGLVTRCWVSAGDAVAASSPVLSMASSEEVLVIARFPAAAAADLCSGGHAQVRVPVTAPGTRSTKIVSVLRAMNDPGDEERTGARMTRIVLSLPNAPPEALWPGTPAAVEIDPTHAPELDAGSWADARSHA
jgi:HlyD family secretion protein